MNGIPHGFIKCWTLKVFFRKNNDTIFKTLSLSNQKEVFVALFKINCIEFIIGNA